MIDINKEYKTRNNLRVRIYATDGAGDSPIHGAIKTKYGWECNAWGENGTFYPCDKSEYDLIEAPTFKDKEPVWGWYDNYSTIRILCFWDDKNKCIFEYGGNRNGLKYDNYAKVDVVEDWMLEMQKKLED